MKKFYLIEENLLKAVIGTMEEMPIRKSQEIIPMINALNSCPLVDVKEKEENVKDKQNGK